MAAVGEGRAGTGDALANETGDVMAALLGILGAVGVVALLPATELARRALLGGTSERSSEAREPDRPFAGLPSGEPGARDLAS